jgi:hypothetical protein
VRQLDLLLNQEGEAAPVAQPGQIYR